VVSTTYILGWCGDQHRETCCQRLHSRAGAAQDKEDHRVSPHSVQDLVHEAHTHLQVPHATQGCGHQRQEIRWQQHLQHAQAPLQSAHCSVCAHAG
jgi:hypothetical protein